MGQESQDADKVGGVMNRGLALRMNDDYWNGASIGYLSGHYGCSVGEIYRWLHLLNKELRMARTRRLASEWRAEHGKEA